MTIPTAPPLRQFISPRYWPTWAGILALTGLAYLPYRARMAAGAAIGALIHALARERRYITATNIALCFPELDAQAQRELVRRTFIANGIGLIETATGWVRDPDAFLDQITFIGLDRLLAAKARGKGVLMLGAHYSTLDFSANLLSRHCPFAVTYRAHKNPLFDAFMQRGRLRNCNGVFDRKDIRGAFRHLKQGEVLWYAPDQDYGPEHAVYAPFFGNRAATITVPSRFARFNDSPVVMVRHHRREDRRGYEMEFTLLEETYPSGDDVADATLINRKIEEGIRHYPHQYLWMHKRFKTQPEGKPASPYIDIKPRCRPLSRAQFENLTRGAGRVEERHSRDRVVKLAGGLYLRVFAGAPPRLLRNRHRAWLFDRRAKALRLRHIDSITVDNIFTVKELDVTAVTYFVPRGRTLAALLSAHPHAVDLKQLAAFFARLHENGFAPDPLDPAHINHGESGFSLIMPDNLFVRPMSLSYMDRCDSLRQLLRAMKQVNPETASEFSILCRHYTWAAGLEDVEAFTSRLNELPATCAAGVEEIAVQVKSR